MAFAVDFRPALAFDNVNNQAALMTVFSRVNLDVLNKNIPVIQDGLRRQTAVTRGPHVMLHQRLARHDPRQIFATDDDLASKRPLALGELVRDDFFVVLTLARTFSITSCHRSSSFFKTAYRLLFQSFQKFQWFQTFCPPKSATGRIRPNFHGGDGSAPNCLAETA